MNTKDFDSAWYDIVSELKKKKFLYTLSKKTRNDILKVADDYIVVSSEKPLHGDRKKRIIRKDDLRFAWGILENKRFLELQDIEPELRGRKSITLAILSQLPYISYETKPLIILTLNTEK